MSRRRRRCCPPLAATHSSQGNADFPSRLGPTHLPVQPLPKRSSPVARCRRHCRGRDLDAFMWLVIAP